MYIRARIQIVIQTRIQFTPIPDLFLCLSAVVHG